MTGLVTSTVLSNKIGEVEDKIPDVSGLVKKTDYDAKMKDIKTSDHKKFTNETLDAKIKQKELGNKSEICNLIKKYDLNTNLRNYQQKQN